MLSLVTSPCSTPEMPLEELLKTHSAVGFHQLEVFTSWVKSAFEPRKDPQYYIDCGRKYGMSFHSLHLPPITDDSDAALQRAVDATRFAEALGCRVVLFKADSRARYIRAAQPYLDAIEGIDITPVLQNHSGSPISTPDDFREVLEGIHDPRMKTLLEVGHFHSVGVSWKEGYELLRESIALVHIKDQTGPQSVPIGAGEIDLPGLFAHMRSTGYTGAYVVEMEVADTENTMRYLKEAFEYLHNCCEA